MGFGKASLVASLALLGAASAQIGLHKASFKSLLQVPPAFSGDGISLFPAHHPDHDEDLLDHLVPIHDRELYYSQEGHRAAVHGAKHAHVKATFAHPAVVLDHSKHVDSVHCPPGSIKVCFTSPEALETVEKSWASDGSRFIISTYHQGCGDKSGHRRSFFVATHPQVTSQCVTASAVPIPEEDALHAVDLKLGTYISPDPRKRDNIPTKGHVRIGGFQHSEPGVRTVDLASNQPALRAFFGDDHLQSTGHQESNQIDFVSIDDGSVPHVEGRGIFADIAAGIESFINSVGDFLSAVVKLIAKIGKLLVNASIIYLKAIASIFGVPFEHRYEEDLQVDVSVTKKVYTRPPVIADIGDAAGFEVEGVDGSFGCIDCSIRADFSLEAELAYTLTEGVTKAFLHLENRQPFEINVVLGMDLDGRFADKELAKKQLVAHPFSPITIPGLFTLGPQASVSVSLNLELEGKLKMVLGGKFKVTAGSAFIGFPKPPNQKNTGLKAKFTPIAEVEGTATVTLGLGLPIALEFGIDVLNGRFKKTIGLIDTPMVYASATVSNEDDAECPHGIDISLGIKNEIGLDVFGSTDVKFREDTIYEKQLACVSIGGFKRETADKQAINQTVSTFNGNLVAEEPATLTEVTVEPAPVRENSGFRILMDYAEDTILVSGTDRSLYLVARDHPSYDISAPWGTLNLDKDIFNLDVFGRLMAHEPEVYFHSYGWFSEVFVEFPEKMPWGTRGTSLTSLKTEDKDFDGYALTMNLPDYHPPPRPKPPFPQAPWLNPPEYKSPCEKNAWPAGEPKVGQTVVFYPTVCKSDNGLRLIATAAFIDKNGKARFEGKDVTETVQDCLPLTRVRNLNDCRTVRLTSKLKNKNNQG